jgi:hypothetical protein
MRRMWRSRRHMRRGFAPNIPPILQEANLAFDKGEFGRAAELFEKIAQAADARGGPRAPLFHLQAGRSRIYAGQLSLAMPCLKRGLELLAQRKQLEHLHRAGLRVMAELHERGLTRESAEIEAFLTPSLPAILATETGSTPAKRPVLPTHCPQCGAALRPDEVEWLDESTAECAYCGSPVRGENQS